MATAIQRIAMYQTLKQLLQQKSITQAAKELKVSRPTVYKYSSMDEESFLAFNKEYRKKASKLDEYEEEIRKRLVAYPDLSAASFEDYFKEHYPDLKVSPRTVFNFIGKVRHKYHLPKTTLPQREYQIVQELPYGKQAQVDFGQSKMDDPTGKKVKVYFMSMSLSRSRYKYICFQTTPFTSQTVIEAHEKAFTYLGGIPKEIVYDQDKTMVIEENKGDVKLTDVFTRYEQERKYSVHLCRKADPESKGKIERVIGYVKHNFLKGRVFESIELLNQQAVAWLERTANSKVHGTTFKIPATEFETEKGYLTPYDPYPINLIPVHKGTAYRVRKDNTIAYRGNFYSLPIGTYTRHKEVYLLEENSILILSTQAGVELARHAIAVERGKVVMNRNHQRDKEHSSRELLEKVMALFWDLALSKSYLLQLKEHKPRYLKDQLSLLYQRLPFLSVAVRDQALEYCNRYSIYSASDFVKVAQGFAATCESEPITPTPLEQVNRTLYAILPDCSCIDFYEQLWKSDIYTPPNESGVITETVDPALLKSIPEEAPPSKGIFFFPGYS